jgi:hypothetical protein
MEEDLRLIRDWSEFEMKEGWLSKFITTRLRQSRRWLSVQAAC